MWVPACGRRCHRLCCLHVQSALETHVRHSLPLSLPLQNLGRKNQAATSPVACPYYVVGNTGCGPFSPTLAAAPSATTQFIFEPAGGVGMRFYIKQSSRAAAGCKNCYVGMDANLCRWA